MTSPARAKFFNLNKNKISYAPPEKQYLFSTIYDYVSIIKIAKKNLFAHILYLKNL